jgi:hypothetical protein
MFILFTFVEGLNPTDKVSLQYSFIIFLTGYIMGGFIVYFLVIENRFKASAVQWSVPRCPRCSQIVSGNAITCSACKHQLRTDSQAKTEIEETPSFEQTMSSGLIIKFCPVCGKNRVENASFCMGCGYQFPKRSKENEQQT